MALARIDGVVFDKDGTLYDFNATWGAWADRVIMEECKGDPDLMDRLAAALQFDRVAQSFLKSSPVIAGTVEQVADLVQPLLPASSRGELIARLNARAAEAPQAEAAPLAPFLTGLKAKGLRLGVATNDAEGPARSHLGRSGVLDLFDAIYGYDSGHGGKPAPGQLLAFCAKFDLSPHACVMVGDSTHDLHAAKAAGFRPVAVLTGPAEAADLAPHAEVVLRSIAELPEWLAQASGDHPQH